jgi:integrase
MESEMLDKYGVDDVELQSFFKALEEDGNEKIRLFCLLSLGTGLRVSEILSLKFDDIDEKNSTLSFTSDKLRSGEQRKHEVALTPSVLAELKKEKKLNSTDINVFQSKKSNNVSKQTAKPLTRQAVNFAFSKANKITGSSITPSKLRQIYIKKFFASVENQAGHFLTKKH